VIAAGSVLVGRPPHVIRPATDADRERLAVLRQHQAGLTGYPGTIVRGPVRAGEHMGALHAYRGKTPSIGAGTVLFDSAERKASAYPRRSTTPVTGSDRRQMWTEIEAR